MTALSQVWSHGPLPISRGLPIIAFKVFCCFILPSSHPNKCLVAAADVTGCLGNLSRRTNVPNATNPSFTMKPNWQPATSGTRCASSAVGIRPFLRPIYKHTQTVTHTHTPTHTHTHTNTHTHTSTHTHTHTCII